MYGALPGADDDGTQALWLLGELGEGGVDVVEGGAVGEGEDEDGGVRVLAANGSDVGVLAGGRLARVPKRQPALKKMRGEI